MQTAPLALLLPAEAPGCSPAQAPFQEAASWGAQVLQTQASPRGPVGPRTRDGCRGVSTRPHRLMLWQFFYFCENDVHALNFFLIRKAHPASRFRPLPWTLQMATLGLEPSLWPRLCSWVLSPRVMGFHEDHQTLFLPILPTPSPWVASSVPRMDGAHAPASSHPAAWLRGSTCIHPSPPHLLLDVSQHPAQRAQTQLLTPLPSLSGSSTTLRMTSEAGEPCPSSSNPSYAPWLASAGFGQFCVLSVSEVGSASTRLSAPAAPLHTSRDMGHVQPMPDKPSA